VLVSNQVGWRASAGAEEESGASSAITTVVSLVPTGSSEPTDHFSANTEAILSPGVAVRSLACWSTPLVVEETVPSVDSELPVALFLSQRRSHIFAKYRGYYGVRGRRV
jgi:hypothetical protein